jgi:glycine betaine/choline ABC-type transport system substrate-binding protein
MKEMIHSEAEYNQMLSDQAQYEAEVNVRMDYECMLREDAIEFLEEFYGAKVDESPEAENLITLVMWAIEKTHQKQMKK